MGLYVHDTVPAFLPATYTQESKRAENLVIEMPVRPPPSASSFPPCFKGVSPCGDFWHFWQFNIARRQAPPGHPPDSNPERLANRRLHHLPGPKQRPAVKDVQRVRLRIRLSGQAQRMEEMK